jgi:TRAP-type C4-dicarboxylate transport system substrate-binding protein
MHEVSKYVVNKPLYNAIGNTLFMNLDTWKKLPADIQKILMDINKDSGPAYVKLVEQNEGAAKDAILAKGKVQLIDWSEADQARWHAMLLDILHKYLTDYMSSVGLKSEGELMWTELNKLRNEYAAFIKTPAGETWLKQFN